MLNVLLVDDNINILEGLSVLIDWETMGFCVSHKSQTAADALEYMENEHIDVVVSDIKMPGMSGIEMIERIKQTKKDVKFILVSGYSEFDYAKWAIDYDISGYLLKPIDEEELIKNLNKIKHEIEKRKEEDAGLLKFYVRRAMEGDVSCIEQIQQLWKCSEIRYLKVKPDVGFDVICRNDNAGKDAAAKIYNALTAQFKEEYCVYIAKKSLEEVELLVSDETYNGSIRSFVKSVFDLLDANCDISAPLIFAGKPVDKMANIYASVETVRMLEDCAFYEENKKKFIYEDYENVEFCDVLTDVAATDRIVNAVKKLNESELLDEVNAFFEAVREAHVKVDSVIMYINKIIFDVCNVISRSGDDVGKYLYRCTTLKKDLHPNFGKAKAFLTENLIELQHCIYESQRKNAQGIVAYIIDDIDTNYSDVNLRLQMYASKYYVNASHLGKIFKERVGTSFNSYLLKVRIEKAKELLRSTDMKIYETAEKVGFSDPNYFSVKFLQVEGITPAKYKAKNAVK